MPRTFLSLVAALVLIWGTGAAFAQEQVVVRLESTNFPGLFIRHSNFKAILTKVESSLDKRDTAFFQRPALNGRPGVSFESVNFPGRYLRHKHFRLVLEPNDGTAQFAADASFVTWPGPAGATGFEASNFAGHFVRHRDFMVYVEQSDDSELFHADSGFLVRRVDGLKIGIDESTRRCKILADTEVYESPGDNHGEALSAVAEGEVVGSTRREWDWYLVHVPGRDGWVYEDFIRCTRALSTP